MPGRAPPPAPGPPPPGRPPPPPPPPPGRPPPPPGRAPPGPPRPPPAGAPRPPGPPPGPPRPGPGAGRDGMFIGLGRGPPGRGPPGRGPPSPPGPPGRALRAPGSTRPGTTGGRARTRATLAALATLARRARGSGTAGGRGRAHAGGRRAERVVTRPGAGTRSPARGRRTGGTAGPLAGAGTTLATACLAATAGLARLRDVRHRRPRCGRAGRPAVGGAGGTGCTRCTGRAVAGSAVPGSPTGTACTWGLRHRRARPGATRGGRGGRSPGRLRLSARRRSGRGRHVRGGRSGSRRTGLRRTGRRGRGCAGRRGRRSGPRARTSLPVAVAVAVPVTVAVRPRGLPLRRTAAGPATRSACWAPFGTESFLEPAHDGRLDRRGRRTYELTHFLELDHHGLALDTELFREFVNPDLRHYSPLPGPGRTGPKPDHSRRSGVQSVLRADVSLWSSSPCAHRALIAVSTCFPTGCRSCLAVSMLCPVAVGLQTALVSSRSIH